MPDGQFYGAILWYHLMVPFYGMCVPGSRAAASSERLHSAASCPQRFSLFSFCDYPTITAEKFEGGQIALSLIYYG